MTLVGTTAPDFTAKAVVGQEIVNYTLSDNWKDGKYTLLFFYPKDFTFVCPTEIIAFSERIDEFRQRGCEVVGVSTDTEFVHLAWKNTPRTEGGLGEIDYPLVADTNKSITTAFDVLEPEEGVAFRGTFLIDREGKIRHMLVNDDPIGRSVDEALRTVDALQFSEEHGQVCPANWQKGDQAIKADPKGKLDFFQTTNGITLKN